MKRQIIIVGFALWASLFFAQPEIGLPDSEREAAVSVEVLLSLNSKSLFRNNLVFLKKIEVFTSLIDSWVLNLRE